MSRGRSTIRGRPGLVAGDVWFESRDAALLRAIVACGSVNGAAKSLGRSNARSLRRIEALEKAFGALVERRRGGRDGGGSRLTDNGRRLLDRFDRLSVAIDATAQIEETVLRGSVSDVDGELAEVETDIGTIQGIHAGLDCSSMAQVRVPSDALTLQDPDEGITPDATSARNYRQGTVEGMTVGESIYLLEIDIEGIRFWATITRDSFERLDVTIGDPVYVTWKATATRLVDSHRR